MIPDDEFYKIKGVPGPTKEEIRCLVMCKARVSSSDVVLDVGCGTGGLTVELSRRVKKVYAVDKNPQAVEVTLKNLKTHNPFGDVELFENDALTIMDDILAFDVLIVGGSSGDLVPIIKKGYEMLKAGGRIIVTAILLETRTSTVLTLKELGLNPEIVEVFIARGKVLDRGTMMEGSNPVAIITGRKSV
ncbi:MAG: precorrin-6Y C5,15-methyltransferase (decarboxylating) subunit CbiT [Methanobacteriales archaeon Met13]